MLAKEISDRPNQTPTSVGYSWSPFDFEAIEFHIDGMKEDGLAIPPPTSCSELVEIAA